MAKLKNRRWERFCVEYVTNGFNASKAARAVGAPAASAGEQGSQYLKKPEFMKRVDELMEDINNDRIMSVTELLELSTAMARGNIKDVYDENGQIIPVHEMSDEVSVGIHEVQMLGDRVTVVKMGKERTAAMERLAKHHNIYDNHQKAGAAVFFMDEKDAAS
jgi:phage terminase small subunit